MIEIVALSDAMREAVRLAERVAGADANVLVTGESGSGKDALSWFIHSRSRRSGESLVKIDCATLPADLLEAELSGYDRGALSGRRVATSCCIGSTWFTSRCRCCVSGAVIWNRSLAGLPALIRRSMVGRQRNCLPARCGYWRRRTFLATFASWQASLSAR